MKIWYNNIAESRRFAAEIAGDRLRIGSGSSNDIVLDSGFVAREAAVITRGHDGWELLVLGRNGCEVSQKQVALGQRCAVPFGATISIFPYLLTIESDGTPHDIEPDRRAQLDTDVSELIRDVHVRLLAEMDLGSVSDQRYDDDRYLLSLERNIDEIVRLSKVVDPFRPPLSNHIAGQWLRGMLIERLLEQVGKQEAGVLNQRSHWSRCLSAVPQREEEVVVIANHAWDELQLASTSDLSRQMELIEEGYWPTWERATRELYQDLREYMVLRQVRKQIKDIVFGYGPLEDLLRTPTITEIMVVNRDRIYIERKGVVENSGRQFISDEVTLAVIERIVSKVGRRIDKSQPLVDARLTDGSRVNAVIPPLAVSGPCLTIRKFPLHRLTIDNLIDYGTLTATVARFLRAAVIKRKNILIAGGTGSGKTTLLNCLSEYIPDKERIVTVEDTAELQLQKEHVVRMETKPANIEGAGAYTIHDLVKNALRMRPDRIVVGECRGPEALDMLQAMNTGHDGSLTTIHANNAEDVILRLEVLVLSAADLPIVSVHRQIASAIDLVVQLGRLRDGRRKVTQVTEFVAMDETNGGVRTRDLFQLEAGRDGGELRPTGQLPTFMGELVEEGWIDLQDFYR
jgi:Flp pilus assembly CpaF family ATPase